MQEGYVKWDLITREKKGPAGTNVTMNYIIDSGKQIWKHYKMMITFVYLFQARKVLIQ